MSNLVTKETITYWRKSGDKKEGDIARNILPQCITKCNLEGQDACDLKCKEVGFGDMIFHPDVRKDINNEDEKNKKRLRKKKRMVR